MGLEVVLFLGLLCHDYSITTFLNKKKLAIARKDFEKNFFKRNEKFFKERERQQRGCKDNPGNCK